MRTHRHLNWTIHPSDLIDPSPWSFVHNDYDGAPDANDNRCGSAQSVEDAVEQINLWEAEAADAAGEMGRV